MISITYCIRHIRRSPNHTTTTTLSVVIVDVVLLCLPIALALLLYHPALLCVCCRRSISVPLFYCRQSILAGLFLCSWSPWCCSAATVLHAACYIVHSASDGSSILLLLCILYLSLSLFSLLSVIKS